MAKHTVSLQSLGLALDAQGQIEITGLALDNRHIKAGDLFAALPGNAVHGARFAQAAIDAGAVAVLTDAAGMAEISVLILQKLSSPMMYAHLLHARLRCFTEDSRKPWSL